MCRLDRTYGRFYWTSDGPEKPTESFSHFVHGLRDVYKIKCPTLSGIALTSYLLVHMRLEYIHEIETEINQIGRTCNHPTDGEWSVKPTYRRLNRFWGILSITCWQQRPQSRTKLRYVRDEGKIMCFKPLFLWRELNTPTRTVCAHGLRSMFPRDFPWTSNLQQ